MEGNSILSKYEYDAYCSKTQYKNKNTINVWSSDTLEPPTTLNTGRAALLQAAHFAVFATTVSPRPARRHQQLNNTHAAS